VADVMVGAKRTNLIRKNTNGPLPSGRRILSFLCVWCATEVDGEPWLL